MTGTRLVRISALLLVVGLVLSPALGCRTTRVSGDEGFVGLVLKQFSPGVVVVDGLASGANAQKVGVKRGDVVLEFKGKKITGIPEFVAAAKETPPGDKASLTVSRDGKRLSFEILVVSRSTFLGAGIEALKGKPMPELSGTLILKNEKFDFSKLKGKPTVLELWATWCPACQANIPHLDAFATRHKGRVNVVALSFESAETVRHFFGRHRVSYDVVASEDGEVNTAYLSNSTIPKFIIVDSKGIVTGLAQSAADLEALNIDNL